MLGKLWLVVTVLLIIASLITHQVALLMVALLFFLAGGIARLWDKYSLKRVAYRRNLSSDHVFFGETIDLEVEINNRKPLPLPWIEINDEIPRNVTLLKGKTENSHLPMNVTLNNLFSIGWYHKIKRHYPIQCSQRGFYTFGPATMRTGDIFGFFARQQEVEGLKHLTVYPRIVPLAKTLVPSNQPMGDIRVKNHLFRDPHLSMGAREYHYGDSLKHIHWKSTARRGALQTRIFDATTTIDMAIFLDVRTVAAPYWGSTPEKLELAIMTAVAIANYALTNGYRAGLYVNQYQHGTGKLIRLAPGQNPGQFKQILEALASIHDIEALPASRLIINESRNLPWVSSMVLITAVPTEELVSALFRIKRTGRKISLVQVGGNGTAFRGTGIDTYHVSDKIPWQDMETLEMMS